MKDRQWTNEPPYEEGLYMVRDTVFGWKTLVHVFWYDNFPWVRADDDELGRNIPMTLMGSWLEWKKFI